MLIKKEFCFDKITLVGHSLGEHLLQLFVLDFVSEVQNLYTFQVPLKDVKNKAYI